MTSGPLVSVVMSAYNGERYLREAMDSILDQTFTNFEFIVINDGSTDRTLNILGSYDDSRLIVVDQPNLGLTKSLNKGLSIARGQFIARQDADDVSIPYRLERQIEFMEQNTEVGLVGSAYIEIGQNGQEIHPVVLPQTHEELYQMMLKGNYICHGSVLFRKKCLEVVGNYREGLAATEDYDLWLRFLKHFLIINLPEHLYKWRFNITSKSATLILRQTTEMAILAEIAREQRATGLDLLKDKNGNEVADIVRERYKQKPLNQRQYLVATTYHRWGHVLLDRGYWFQGMLFLLKAWLIKPEDWHTFSCLLANLRGVWAMRPVRKL